MKSILNPAMNKLKYFSFSLVLSLLAFSGTYAAEYELDKAHSSITFGVSHMTVSKTTGNFKAFDTEIVWDDKNLAASKLNATIVTQSIDTDNAKRDEHLRNEDFFDAPKHPKITFVSEKIEKTDKGYTVTGKLTMRGVTKTVSIPFEAKGPITDPYKKQRIGLSGILVVDRFDYGISYGAKAMIGAEVEIEINVEATAK